MGLLPFQRPRLQVYAIKGKEDPLWSGCAAGAAGDEAAAAACYTGWMARVPQYITQMSAIRKELWAMFPNTKPVSATLPPGVGGGDVYSGTSAPLWNLKHARALTHLRCCAVIFIARLVRGVACGIVIESQRVYFDV